MAVKLKVTYADGREERIVVTPAAQVMTEDVIGFSEEHKVKAGYHLAWATLQTTGRETADFATWLTRIADVDQIDETEERPTPEAQPTTT